MNNYAKGSELRKLRAKYSSTQVDLDTYKDVWWLLDVIDQIRIENDQLKRAVESLQEEALSTLCPKCGLKDWYCACCLEDY